MSESPDVEKTDGSGSRNSSGGSGDSSPRPCDPPATEKEAKVPFAMPALGETFSLSDGSSFRLDRAVMPSMYGAVYAGTLTMADGRTVPSCIKVSVLECMNRRIVLDSKQVPRGAKGEDVAHGIKLHRHLLESPTTARFVPQIYCEAKCSKYHYFCTEMASGDLFSLLDRMERDHLRPEGGWTRKVRIRVVLELFRCIAALHSRGVAHIDCSLENYLYFGDPREDGGGGAANETGREPSWRPFRVAAVDFGSAAICSQDFATRLVEPHRYFSKLSNVSPESFTCSIADARRLDSLDVWAAGCMCYTLLTGHYPFNTGPGCAYRDVYNRKGVPGLIAAMRTGHSIPRAMEYVLEETMYRDNLGRIGMPAALRLVEDYCYRIGVR